MMIRIYNHRRRGSEVLWGYDDVSLQIVMFVRRKHGRPEWECRVLEGAAWVEKKVPYLFGGESGSFQEEIARVVHEALAGQSFRFVEYGHGHNKEPHEVKSQWLPADPKKLYEWPKTIDSVQRREMLVKIFREAPNYEAARIATAFKQADFRSRMEREAFDWEKAYPREHVREIQDWFGARDEDCMDNRRVADASRPAHKRHYQKQKEHGCCGSVDEVLVIGRSSLIGGLIDAFRGAGTRYWVGFNYGH